MTSAKKYWAYFCEKIKALWHGLWRHVRAWGLFRTVGVMIVICLFALVVAWSLWSWCVPDMKSEPRSTVSLATVGGLGGLVALVVSYRKQAMNERSEVDGELADAVHLLGEEKPSTRIAGVYALANVGDRYPDRRQQIIDILCGYLRTKREDDGPTESTIIATLKSKLNENSWTKDRDIDLDLRNATITEYFDLSNTKIHDLILNNTKFGNAVFDGAVFNGYATFNNATFNIATFMGTAFTSVRVIGAVFHNTTFNGTTTFEEAVFNSDAVFNAATFKSNALFNSTVFNGYPTFGGAVFNSYTEFDKTVFNNKSVVDDIRNSATFKGDVAFTNIIFKDANDMDE